MTKRGMEVRSARPRTFDFGAEVDGYLNRIINDTDVLAFGNPESFNARDPLRLSQVWQMPAVIIEDTQFVPADATDAKILVDARTPLPLVRALEARACKAVVALAPPGYGKSTMCLRQTHRLAETARSHREGWIPVLVPLRLINRHGVWSDANELFSCLAAVKGNKSLGKALEDHLAKGHLWLFFDGLDEVKRDKLSDIRKSIAALASGASRVTVTCRLADYRTKSLNRTLEFPAIVLQSFSDDQLEEYIQGWHQAAARLDQSWESGRLARTRTLIGDNREIRALAGVPMLAALICVVGASASAALSGRATFYRRAVEHLLSARDYRFDELAHKRRSHAHVDESVLQLLVQRLAYRMSGISDGESTPQLSGDHLWKAIREELEGIVTTIAHSHSEIETVVREYYYRVCGSTAMGLMQEAQDDTYEFIHYSFQEYLTAQYLTKFADRQLLPALAAEDDWVEILRFIASIARTGDSSIADVLILVRTLLLDAERELQAQSSHHDAKERAARSTLVASEMLAEMGAATLRAYGFYSALESERPSGSWRSADPGFRGIWQAAAELCLHVASDSHIDLAVRTRAICAASRLGDPRFIDTDGQLKPELERLIQIPGGQGRIGTEEPLSMMEPKRVRSDPEVAIMMQEFKIGKYPVTNIEYGRFIEANGYEDPQWWCGNNGRLWQTKEHDFIEQIMKLWVQNMSKNFWKEEKEEDFGGLSERSIAKRTIDRSEPLYWRDMRFNVPTAPVVGVNWWEACAYCRWYTAQLRADGTIGPMDLVDLPTENEWEWVASMQWCDNRRCYPWGDDFDADRCLVRDWGDGTGEPTIKHFGGIPVGFFSLGRSEVDNIPQDLSGNVWEWVRCKSAPYGQQPDRSELHPRIVRGGSWFSREPLATHSSFRLDDEPFNAYWDLGFRIVVRHGDIARGRDS